MLDDMREVEIAPMRREQLRPLLSEERNEEFDRAAELAGLALDARVVWNVSATAQGGGVAEMLQTLLALARATGVDTRWLVLSGTPAFFAVTKRLHNMLHGEPGDGGPLGAAEHEVLAATLQPDVERLLAVVRPRDLVLLHDPQPAGMVQAVRATGAKVVWRCHIGRDTPNELSQAGWAFLRPLIEEADAFIFSRRAYVPEWVDDDRLSIITPSIDPLSPKNVSLTDEQVESTLGYAGLLAGTSDPRPVGFVRRDDTLGTTRPHVGLDSNPSPIPAGARLVTQVSRWDRLKDMGGVMTGFVDHLADLPDDVHLLLVGPDVSGVTDDPEGASNLAECRGQWERMSVAQRERVHLVCLPMDDIEENAHLVNALQRRSAVVVQKSLVEGFGLTVTEAMWKGCPVVASGVGGIQDQIVDGANGLLLADPYDLNAFGAALTRLVADPDLAAKLGAAAHTEVYDRFLSDRHLEAYANLFLSMLG
jgi:trehalose synthase